MISFMKDENKTKRQLMEELAGLHQRVAELESTQAGHVKPEVREQRQEQDRKELLEEWALALKRVNDALKEEIEDRKRRENVLHEDHAVLEAIFSNIHYLIAFMDRDFNFIRVNGAYAKAGGKPPSFFVGKNHFELYPHKENEEIFRRVVETGEPYHAFAKAFEYPDRPELGVTFWDWTLTPIKAVDGKVASTVLSLIDVTEAARAKEKLLKSESRYRNIFNSVPVSIWEEDFSDVKSAVDALNMERVEDLRKYLSDHPDFIQRAVQMVKILDVNNESLKMFGARDKSDLTASLDKIFVEETLEVFREELIALYEGDTHFESESVIQTLKGEKKTVILSIFFPPQESEFHNVLVSIADITERKRAEHAIREIKTLIVKTYESLDEMVFVVEPLNRTIIACNPAAERIFGYSQEEVLGRSTEFLHVDRSAYEKAGVEIFSALDRAEVYKGEYDLKRKDGTIFPVEWTITEIVDDSGHRTGVVSVGRDITERRRSEEEIRGYIRELEQSNKALDEFAYVASHDLQEPLRKIQTFGDRLMSKFSDALTQNGLDYLERMVKASRRMQNLIDALLTYSRLATRESLFIPVNLAEIAAEAVSNLEARIEESGGTVQVNDLPSIEADDQQMLQLIQNLLGNALKFHREGIPPQVKISARIIAAKENSLGREFPRDGLCEIEVEDNGIGFDEKHLDRIFSPFQRLHGRSKYDGVGIGLAVCRKIVEQHHGIIMAKSKPGVGSTFIVRLPVKQHQVISDQ
jgi:two-component system sensor kinase FixL